MSFLLAVVALAVGAGMPATASAQIGIKKPKIPTVPKVPTVTTPAVPAQAADSAKPADAPAPADTAAPAAAKQPEGPGQGAWVNFDFQPGERPLYVDDFSADRVGNFPKRLEFVEGNMEVAEWNGARYLRTTSRSSQFAIVLPESLPERFTMEFDATSHTANIYNTIKFSPNPTSYVTYRYFNGKREGGIDGTGPKALGFTPTELPAGVLLRVRIMVDGQYVKVYLGDTRVANVPNAKLGRSNRIEIEFSGTENEPVFLGNFSVLAGGRELYDALAESGRVAVQGIYFDTGSDRIRPESTPTLVEIAQMMKGHPDLALLIEGHTDNVGNAVSNQTLSEKRAAAVKQSLVSMWSVDAARLTTAGFGSTKPAGPNTTPEGRQANRRVELVKK
jgi:outer membrane protein OmpA-like peptidoglycan-associated protein